MKKLKAKYILAYNIKECPNAIVWGLTHTLKQAKKEKGWSSKFRIFKIGEEIR